MAAAPLETLPLAAVRVDGHARVLDANADARALGVVQGTILDHLASLVRRAAEQPGRAHDTDAPARRGATWRIHARAEGDDGTVLLLLQDVTVARTEATALARDAAVFRASPDAVAILDAGKRVRRVNDAFERLIAPEAAVQGKRLALHLASVDLQRFRLALGRVGRGGTWRGEARIRARKGEVPTWTTIAPVPGEGDDPWFLVSFAPIEALKRTEDALDRQARHDPLTGLPNRRALQAHLQGLLHRRRAHDHGTAVLFVDLDRFKQINDTLGHEAGDELLRQVAGRLQRRVRADDLVARTGGDEFVVVLRDLGDPAVAHGVAQDLAELLAAPYTLSDATHVVTASLGLALAPQHGTTYAELVKRADDAMYAAKQAGRNTVRAASDPEVG